MKDCFTYKDCVARFEDGEFHNPVEWENFPIYHTDPFWNAALFDEPPYPGFRAAGTVITMSADPSAGGPTLWIKESVSPSSLH